MRDQNRSLESKRRDPFLNFMIHTDDTEQKSPMGHLPGLMAQSPKTWHQEVLTRHLPERGIIHPGVPL